MFNRHLMKLQEAWAVMDEAMQDFNDTVCFMQPSNREFILYQATNESRAALESLDIEAYLESGPLGIMVIRWGSEFDEIDSVAAHKGWGPLVYYTTLVELAKYSKGSGFLAPTQSKGQVTPAAATIWMKMPEEYLEKKPVKTPVHDIDELNYAYKASKVLVSKYGSLIDEAKRRSNKFIKSFPNPNKVKEIIWEAATNHLDSELNKIYNMRR